jgi:hypothetical protein
VAADDDSGPRQFPDAQDLVLRRLADRGRRNGDDGDRLACGRKDLKLVTFGNVGARRIVLDNYTNVTCAKAFLGKVPRQDDSMVEGKGHGVYAGMSVTSLGAVSPVRMIHIVRTQPVLPFGPVNGPRISYFCP